MSRFRDVQQELDKAAHDRLVYPATGVMLNRLGLRDATTLHIAERILSRERLAQGLPAEAKAPTYEGLKAIHRHLLQDVYDWAGQQREYTTRRSDVAAFTPPALIERNMTAIFADFQAKAQLRGLEPSAFAAEAARFIGAINGVHPFNDGNGRTQRAWLANVADAAGFHFALKPGERAEWHEASRIAFEDRDPGPMTAFIASAIAVPERVIQGPHEATANAFLTLSRSEALASGNPALGAAWKALDVFQAAMTRAFPADPAQVASYVARAQVQLADRLRDGQAITIERAAVVRSDDRVR